MLKRIGVFIFFSCAMMMSAFSENAHPSASRSDYSQQVVLPVTSALSAQPSRIQEGVFIDPIFFAAEHPLESAPHFARSLCDLPGFHCQSVRPDDTWVGLWPNKKQRDIVMRLNRTNVALAYLSWVVVPDDLAHINYMDLSPLPQYRQPTGKSYVYIDLSSFSFGAYDKTGKLVYWGPISSGAQQCPNTAGRCTTVVGNFHVYRMQGADCISHTYPLETHGGAAMPYCMHFYKGYAMHGSTLSGFTNRSQGCIRMFDDDAKWLNHQFVKKGTGVIVVR